MFASSAETDPSDPTPADRRRWAQYLADERAEAATYRSLAERREGDERQILEELCAAEKRHEQHWLRLLDGEPDRMPKASMRTRTTAWLASHFGSIFTLALAQLAEARSPYDTDPHASPRMRADEKVHHEVVRGLAARSRRRLSGTFRAAVFGANDGLVSNLALVMGIGATGVSGTFVLFSGIAGLLAGALSMGAGEFVSVKSQRELLESTEPSDYAHAGLPDLDLDANELALVYRTRGLSAEEAEKKARGVVGAAQAGNMPAPRTGPVSYEVVGSAWRAALSSFLLFSGGAIIPVLPWIFGLSGVVAVVVALVLVGIALLATGAMVGLLSGASPLPRALRQLAIGFGAAAVTYALGLLFGVSVA
ncbi:MAG: VIT1/CCC1 transporter family protein [Microbacterium gubbeenense]|uniref:VIT1/CCC1 transporter family protein n=1 Tax=Microbacteriaceae TaxID=85023 RepID=UPI00040F3898|nr:VIT1/CCC1 transporter family protein [Microbacterium gubbeenense]